MRGSPPRVRGKVSQKTGFALTTRITPACAGKSPPNLMSQFPTPDHPRVCGEKEWKDISTKSIIGSPPRVRGKVAAEFGYSRSTRITPACAGKSLGMVASIVVLKDHPRVCGEKIFGIGNGFGRLGSPPRVRGKECYFCKNPRTDGITPACAGKSYHHHGSGVNGEDHPRVCGEKTKKSP